MIKYAFLLTCGVVVGGLLVEYKDYFTQQIAVPIATLADGGVYEGELSKGKLQGQGRIRWPDGSYYAGDFDNGLFEGDGRLDTPTYVYEGTFTLGTMTGEGTLTLMNGDSYVGEVNQGLFNGEGTFTSVTGEQYIGEFENDLYHGQGELLMANGDRYVGEFSNNFFHGQGVYTQLIENNLSIDDVTTTEVFSGEFVEGQFTGQGIWIEGDKRYEGQFREWVFNGDGEYNDDNGTYIGQFSDGLFEGEGTYKHSNGSVYQGEFSNNRYEGKGKLVDSYGDTYEGFFKRGRRHGNGVLIYAEPLDGIASVKGEWQYGRLISADNPRLVVSDGELAEHAIYHQVALLDEALDEIKENNPEAIELYFVGVAGDGSEGVFRRELEYIRPLFDVKYGTAGRSINLINSPFSYDQVPLATITSIEKTLQSVAKKMDKENDILFLYLTSHGSRDFQFYLSQSGLSLDSLSAKKLGTILNELPVRHKVVVISACFSGGFVESIKDDYMMVVTAASADKTSFGCSDRAKMTYFGEAFFKDALPQSASFVDAFDRARDILRAREAKEGFTHSAPLIFKPKAIVKQLEKWRGQENIFQ